MLCAMTGMTIHSQLLLMPSCSCNHSRSILTLLHVLETSYATCRIFSTRLNSTNTTVEVTIYCRSRENALRDGCGDDANVEYIPGYRLAQSVQHNTI